MPIASDALQLDLLTADPVSPSEGQLWYNSTSRQFKSFVNGSVQVSAAKTNITTTAPTANNDSSQGYSIGSWWINTTTGIFYVCVADTPAAAVWTSGSGASSLTVKDEGTPLTPDKTKLNFIGPGLTASTNGVDTAQADVTILTAAPPATSVGTTSSDGTANTLARSDHVHQSNTAPVNVTKAAAAIGTSGEPARADHKHDVTTAAAAAVGTANTEGAATSLARSDHTHQVTGLTITGQAQGDILYFNGTAWVRLGAGTAGQVLQTNGAGANPSWVTAGAGTSTFRQSVFLEQTTDTTTTVGPTAWAALLSQAITISAGGIVIVNFTFSVSNTANNGQKVDFRLLIDGVATRGVATGTKSNGIASGGGLVYRKTGLSTGSHTFAIQWRTAGGTARIRPVTAITEHASLLLQEVGT